MQEFFATANLLLVSENKRIIRTIDFSLALTFFVIVTVELTLNNFVFDEIPSRGPYTPGEIIQFMCNMHITYIYNWFVLVSTVYVLFFLAMYFIQC